MKNKLSDVRDHLVVMLEHLGDTTPDHKPPEDLIERAKATALVAGQYIAAVKTEIEARKLYAEYGGNPGEVDAVPLDRKPRLVSMG